MVKAFSWPRWYLPGFSTVKLLFLPLYFIGILWGDSSRPFKYQASHSSLCPLILASSNDSRVQQLLLAGCEAAVFSFHLLFLLHLFIETVRKSASSFSHRIIFSYQCALIDICFILWVIIYSHHYLFGCSDCSRFGYWKKLQEGCPGCLCVRACVRVYVSVCVYV